jgi:hypothetical protein
MQIAVHKIKRPLHLLAEGALLFAGGDRLAVKDAGTTPPKRQFEPGSSHQLGGAVLLEAARPRIINPGIWPQGK